MLDSNDMLLSVIEYYNLKKDMMKRIAIVFFAAMLFAAASAQNDGQRRHREFNPEDMALMQTARIHEAVKLDSVQYQAIFLINYADALTMQDSMKARRERYDKMRANGEHPQRMQYSEEQMKMRREVERQRREVRNEKFKQILSPEQFESFIKMEEQQMKKMREGRRGHGRQGRNGGSPGQR